MRVFYFLLVWLLCIAGILHAQPVNVVGVSVTGRFNSCSGGSNLPTVTANLISTGSGSSVSSGVFQCNNRCDSSKIRVTISGIRWNKSPNAEWLHGLFLPANAGFSVTPVSVPPGFITYNPGCVGTCPSGSGTNGGPGFYFDNTTGNSCCGTVTANDGFPCNNYGDVTIDCGGSFSISFDMTFCNSIITSGFYQFIFTGTSDGETGCYNFNDMLPHHIAFTIMTQPCSLPVMNLSASVPERHCTGSLVNYTSTLTGTCTGNTIFWWDAPTGGNLLGSGSPFVFDPAGSACPAGTTLYATCCPGSNTICVLREPVTIPGTCLPLQIDSVSKSNGVCGQPGAINAVFLSNTQGIVNYTLQPGGITNTTGIFPNLTQTQYTLQVTDASQCTVSTVISISQSTAVQLGAPQMTSPDCINPFSGSITVVANGGTTPYLYSISPTATQSSPGVFTSLNSQSYTIQVSDNTGCSSSMVVVLQPSLSPVFSSILITPPLCYGDQNASIQATATGGSGTLTYTLQPALLSNTSGQFLNLTSGVYQITCTDTMGCSHDSTITINDPLPLQLSTLNSTPVSCSYLSDGSIQCTGTGGTGNYTYHLNPGAINNTTGYYGNLASGLYTLTLSDGNNCSYTQTVWVDSVPILGILQLQGINATCFGSNNASIQVQGTGGTAPYIYTVNPGAASSSSGFFNGLGSGIYTLQIHDQHNCLYTDSIQLISPPAMVWQNTQFTHPNCAGTNTGSIVVQATGGSGSIQYQLMPGGLNSTTGNFTMLNAGFYTVTAIDANNCLLTTVFQLVSPTVLQWTLNSSTDVSCFGQANGIIEVQASGGTGILNYQLWMPLQNNSSGLFNSLNPATYSVQVTDANGCSLQTTLLISEPAPLQFTNTTLFIPACFGNSNGSIQTNGSGGTTPYSFTLLPSSFQNNTGLFNSLSAGNYTIQLSDWNGCTNDTTIQIVNPLPLVLDSVEVQTTTCLPGNDGIITIWASGGNAPLQYSHGGPFQTSNQFSSMNSGSYTLTVLDANGCSITSVQTLQTPNAPQILQVYTDSVTCHGYSDGSVQVVAGGGSGLLTYTIQPGTIINSTGLFSLLSGGLYTVSVKDSLQCESSQTVNLPEPAAMGWTIQNQLPISCYGFSNGSIQFQAGGGSGPVQYMLWPGGITNSTGSFANLSAGTYTLQATDLHGCTLDTLLPLQQPNVLSFSSCWVQNPLCSTSQNASITAIGMGGSLPYTFTLYPGSISNSSGSFVNLSAGNYTLQLKDNNNCIHDTILLITAPPTLAIDSVISTPPGCIPGNDGSIMVLASGGVAPYSYSLNSTVQGTPLFNALTSGIYLLTLTDQHGCSVTQSVTLQTPNAPVFNSLNSDSVSCFGLTDGQISVSATGNGTTLMYTLLPATISNTSGQFPALSAGLYTVMVTDSLGCTSQSTLTVAQPPLLQWQTTGVQMVTCAGLNNGSIQVTAMGGSGSYQFQLMPGMLINSSGLFTALSNGLYTVQVSDNHSCTASVSLNVTQPASLQWDSVQWIAPACFGTATAQVHAAANGGTAPYTYQLLPTASVNNSGWFTGISAGLYTLVVTDSNSCPYDTTFQIIQPSVPQIDSVFTTAPGCNPGNAGTLTVFAQGGTAPLQYSLGAGFQPSGLFTTLTASSYTILVQDANGCTQSSIATVTNPNNPQIDSVITQPAGCNPSNSGSLNIYASGGTAPYLYSIDGTNYQTTTVFSGVSSGTYTIQVKDALGCSYTSVLFLNTTLPPSIQSVGTTPASCSPGCDGMVNITALAGGSPITGYSIDGINFQPAASFSSLCATVYTIVVLDASGCTASAIQAISVANGPQWISGNGSNLSCYGVQNGGIQVSASGGNGTLLYILNPGSISNSSGIFTTLGAGQYTVTVQDTALCSNQTTITLTQPPLLQFGSIISNSSPCSGLPGGILQIPVSGGTGSYSYSSIPVATFQPPSSFINLSGNTTYTIQVLDAANCSISTIVYVGQPAPLQWTSIQTVPVSCNGAGDGSILAQATGGSGILTYTLQPGNIINTTGMFNGLSGNTYTLQVSDSNNCSRDTVLTITEAPPVTVLNNSVSSLSCAGTNDGSIVFQCSGGSGGFSYQLNPLGIVNSTGSFTNLPSNSYTVTATDMAGCTNAQPFTVASPPAIQFDTLQSIPISCSGGTNGSIHLHATGGTGMFTYTLFPGSLSNSSGWFLSLNAGTYTVQASDNSGCTSSQILTVVQPPVLNTGNPQIQNLSCFGAMDGSIQVNVAGGTSPYQFILQPLGLTNNTGLFTNLSSAVYTLYVSDSNACADTLNAIFVQEPPQIIFSGIQSVPVSCFGDSTGSISLLATGGTGTLSYDIQPVNLQTLPPYTQLPAGSYTITCTDVTNCSQSVLVHVDQNSALFFPVLNVIPSPCAGDRKGSIQCSASGGIPPYVYTLSNGSQNNTGTFQGLAPSTYTVHINDALGCTYDTVIILNDPPRIQILQGLSTGVPCADVGEGSLEFTAIGGTGVLTYYLNPGVYINQSGLFQHLSAGNYTLHIKDSLGCTLDSVFQVGIEGNAMVLDITKQNLSCTGTGFEGWAEVAISGGEAPFQFEWNTNPPQYTPRIEHLTFGWYWVEVQDANGCRSMDTVYIEPGPCCEAVFLPNAFSPDQDGLNDRFHITSSAGMELLQFDVYNRWGNRVWGTRNYLEGWDGRYKNKDAAADTYFYILRYRCLHDHQEYVRKGDILLLR